MSGRELEELVRSIVASARGNIESAMIVSEEGFVLAHNPVTGNDDYVAAVVAAIGGAAKALSEYVKPASIGGVQLELSDGRRLIIRNRGNGYLVCVTRPRANMGWVELVVEQHGH